MPPTDPPARPERVETDSSLRAERERADVHIAKAGSGVATSADEVVELARERADALLEAARELADAKSQAAGEGSSPTLSAARASEDEEVSDARHAADDQLDLERAAHALAHLRSLTLERDATDAHLVTERVRSDDAVASRDDFLAIVSHDVRNLLASMALSSEVLLQPPGQLLAVETEERVRTEAHRIRRLTGQMNRLIGDLLDVASMESGKLRIDPSEQDASRLLRETMDTFELAARTRELQLSCEIAPGSLLAAFDHERLLQVLTNLVGNAMKFTPSGGTIGLRLAATAAELRFTVRDSGRGIAAEQLEVVFDRFAQADKIDRRGLGLGLFIARGIIEAHGGTIWAESELGVGSAFHFTLPALRPPLQA